MAWSNSDIATAGTALIAFIALVRPDVERLSRRWKTNVDVHPAGNAEIGFSTFGPTIGLQGVVRSIDGDVFISSAHVVLERVADHLRHEFEWAVFRPPLLGVTGSQGYEIAAGFYLQSSSPRRFNVQFHDLGTAAKYRSLLADWERRWLIYLNTKNIILANLPPNTLGATFDDFRSQAQDTFQKTHQVMERVFYWVEGDYKMTVNLKTSRPDKAFETEFKFTLNTEECSQLRYNIFGCMFSKCSQPVIWNFANPVYSRID